MKIKQISIKNFRGIENLPNFEIGDFSILVGENGMSKTSILEAIHFCLSPYYLSGRIKHTDFFNGTDEPIEIMIEFDENFKAFLPDGYTKQEIECKKIYLWIKKREKAASNKAFSDIVTIDHHAIPNRPKDNADWWVQKRKNGTDFEFNERFLSLSIAEISGLPRSFYFAKDRDKKIQKWYNSPISSVFNDFNWRFNREIRKMADTETEELSFAEKSNILESEILEKIDEKSHEKTFVKLNTKLNKLWLPNISLSFIDSMSPFDSAFLSRKIEELILPIDQVWSGVEMIVSLLFLETMAEIAKEDIFILIDEPELHLHPHLQEKFVEHLIKLSEDNKVLISTHSPLFVKQSLQKNEHIAVNILKKENNKIIIAQPEQKVLSYISANEINFIAFDLATEEYHNELHEELKNINGPNRNLKDFDFHFFHQNKWEPITEPYNWNPQNPVTIHTHLRTQIHHRGANGSPNFNEMENSIRKMRTFF
jgi:predicted ATP-dependent endonuclease of OLD family